MKKFLITLIYASLASLVMAYLFKAMYWTGFENMATAALWLHIGSYLGYSLMVNPKDDRIIYPMIVLVLVVLANVFHLGETSTYMALAVYVLLFAYTGYHLLVKDYLDKNDLGILRKISIGALTLFLVAGVFKIMHLQGADILLMVGCGAVAFMLLSVGTTKGLVRKK